MLLRDGEHARFAGPDKTQTFQLLAFGQRRGFWILRIASAIWSMSLRGPSSMFWKNQTASWHSRSLTGHWVRSSQRALRRE